MMEIKNRQTHRQTVLITGGSRGIGAACARLFAARGSRVVIGYKENKEAAERLAADLNRQDRGAGQACGGGQACGAGQAYGGDLDPISGNDTIQAAALRADVTKADEVAELFSRARAIFGSIDVLVNNAGIAEFRMFTDITEEKWDLMMDTNCKGMYLCAREALADMLPRKKGAIVNVSSMWGQVGASCEVHYSASKAAVIGLTKALAKELGPSGIRVNCVAPGAVETDMMANVPDAVKKELAEETPLTRLGTPGDIAKAIYFLASEDAGFITGQVLSASGGFVMA